MLLRWIGTPLLPADLHAIHMAVDSTDDLVGTAVRLQIGGSHKEHWQCLTADTICGLHIRYILPKRQSVALIEPDTPTA